MELAQLSLCDSVVDYSNLLSTLNLVKNIIRSDNNGNLIQFDPGVQILVKLFYGTAPSVAGIWYNWTPAEGPPAEGQSCFKELNIYYFEKQCGYFFTPWLPIIDKCTQEALDIANGGPYVVTSWKKAVDLLASYLGLAANSLAPYSLQNVLKVLKALCDLIKQREYIDKILSKSVTSTNHCDI